MSSNFKKTTIAITGATGFVGKFLIQYFSDKGYKIHAFGRQKEFSLRYLVEDYSSWDISTGKLEKDLEVDIVIHCAGSVSYWGDYKEMEQVNTIGTQNVIQSFPDAKFIHISTASVYDPYVEKLNISENIQKPEKYLNYYQETKWQAEQIVIKNSLNYIIFRPHAIYGPNDTTLLPRLMRARKEKFNKFLLVGDGQNQTSLTYVGNLAIAIELAIESKIKNEIYNVTDLHIASLKQILDEFKKVKKFPEKYLVIPKIVAWNVGLLLEMFYKIFKLKKEPLLTRYVVSQLTSKYVLNISKIKKDLGYDPKDNFLNKFQESYGN